MMTSILFPIVIGLLAFIGIVINIMFKKWLKSNQFHFKIPKNAKQEIYSKRNEVTDLSKTKPTFQSQDNNQLVDEQTLPKNSTPKPQPPAPVPVTPIKNESENTVSQTLESVSNSNDSQVFQLTPPPMISSGQKNLRTPEFPPDEKPELLRIYLKTKTPLNGKIISEVLKKHDFIFQEGYYILDNQPPHFYIANAYQPIEFPENQQEMDQLQTFGIYLILPLPIENVDNRKLLTNLIEIARKISFGLSADMLDEKNQLLDRKKITQLKAKIKYFYPNYI